MLHLLGSGLRTLNDDVVERSTHQFHVMPIGASYGQRDGYTLPFRQQAALRRLCRGL